MTNLEAFGGRRNLAVAAPQGDTTHRTPPHNIEAEQALLGAILVNNDAFDSVSGFLQPEHFSEALHQRIFEIASQLIRAGKVATPVTLKTFLTEQDVGHCVTVSQYLARLAAEATPIILAEDYGRTVLDLSVRRDLAIIGEDIVNSAHDAPVDSSPWMQIAEASAKLSEISLADTPAAPATERIQRSRGTHALPIRYACLTRRCRSSWHQIRNENCLTQCQVRHQNEVSL
jgi:replicative DNA helicase